MPTLRAKIIRLAHSMPSDSEERAALLDLLAGSAKAASSVVGAGRTMMGDADMLKEIEDLSKQFDLDDSEGRADFRTALDRMFRQSKLSALREYAEALGEKPKGSNRWDVIRAIARAFPRK